MYWRFPGTPLVTTQKKDRPRRSVVLVEAKGNFTNQPKSGDLPVFDMGFDVFHVHRVDVADRFGRFSYRIADSIINAFVRAGDDFNYFYNWHNNVFKVKNGSAGSCGS